LRQGGGGYLPLTASLKSSARNFATGAGNNKNKNKIKTINTPSKYHIARGCSSSGGRTSGAGSTLSSLPKRGLPSEPPQGIMRAPLRCLYYHEYGEFAWAGTDERVGT
jgi:hypothetical protein